MAETNTAERFMEETGKKKKVLMLASVASMIDQFNMPNIRLLLEMGYEVHVACNLKEGNTCNMHQIHKMVKQMDSMHIVLHPWDCPRNVTSIQKCFTAYRQLWKLCEKYCYAWMHCQSPVGGAIARLVAHRAGIPTIYTAHGFHFYKGAPLKNWLLYYPVEKLLSYWTDILITVNIEDYSLAKKHFKAKNICHISGVGIDTNKYASKSMTRYRKKYGIPFNAVLLLSVGELSKRKNHKTVIDALARLQRRDVYYLICGQGRLKKSLSEYAEKMGVMNYVRMPGFLEHVEKVYQETDIFVFPSYQEGLPMALLEAMASGLPCVVSDIRGNRELVCNAELRFAPERPDQLHAILDRLLEDKSGRELYGACNREKAGMYELTVVQRRMRIIYQWMERKTREGD